MKQELIKIYKRDLDRLKNEITIFKKEENLWNITGNIHNSAGNLCLHLVGNLHTYIGKNIGSTGYVRNRDLEFSERNKNKVELVEMIENTHRMIEKTLEELPEQALDNIYPENVLGYEMTTRFFLLHLIAHLSYHLGQINYIRRILE